MKLLSEGKLIKINHIYKYGNPISIDIGYILLDVFSGPIIFYRGRINKNIYKTRDVFERYKKDIVFSRFINNGEEEVKIDNTPQLYNKEKGIIEIINSRSLCTVVNLQFTLT